jgi:hypothetical protein
MTRTLWLGRAISGPVFFPGLREEYDTARRSDQQREGDGGPRNKAKANRISVGGTDRNVQKQRRPTEDKHRERQFEQIGRHGPSLSARNAIGAFNNTRLNKFLR